MTSAQTKDILSLFDPLDIGTAIGPSSGVGVADHFQDPWAAPFFAPSPTASIATLPSPSTSLRTSSPTGRAHSHSVGKATTLAYAPSNPFAALVAQHSAGLRATSLPSDPPIAPSAVHEEEETDAFDDGGMGEPPRHSLSLERASSCDTDSNFKTNALLSSLPPEGTAEPTQPGGLGVPSDALRPGRRRSATIAVGSLQQPTGETPESQSSSEPLMVLDATYILNASRNFMLRHGLNWAKQNPGVVFDLNQQPAYRFVTKTMSMRGKLTLVDIQNKSPLGAIARGSFTGGSNKIQITDPLGEPLCSVKRASLPPCTDLWILITKTPDKLHPDVKNETAIPLFVKGNPGLCNYDVVGYKGHLVMRVRRESPQTPRGDPWGKDSYFATVPAGVDVVFALLLCQSIEELFHTDRDSRGGI